MIEGFLLAFGLACGIALTILVCLNTRGLGPYAPGWSPQSHLMLAKEAATSTLFELCIKERHVSRKFVWCAWRNSKKAGCSLVPNCYAIVVAKRHGVRITHVRVVRRMNIPFAIEFTLPDVMLYEEGESEEEEAPCDKHSAGGH